MAHETKGIKVLVTEPVVIDGHIRIPRHASGQHTPCVTTLEAKHAYIVEKSERVMLADSDEALEFLAKHEGVPHYE